MFSITLRSYILSILFRQKELSPVSQSLACFSEESPSISVRCVITAFIFVYCTV